MLQSFVDFVLECASDLGYLGIVLLMTLESCFVPFPSEVVMIPAGYLASKGEMNALLAILCGVLGSVLGALINYYLCYWWGRAFVLIWGKFVGINEQKFAKFEALVRMNLVRFVAFTALGSALWVSILVALGYFVGENETLIKEYLHEILIIIVLFIIVLSVIYIKIKKPFSS